MTRVIVYLYDHPDKANTVVQSLHHAGFDDSQMECIESDPESKHFFRRLFKSDRQRKALKTEQATRALLKLGLEQDVAAHYADAIRKGCTLVALRCDEELSGRANQIMNRFPADENKEYSTLDNEPHHIEDRHSSSLETGDETSSGGIKKIDILRPTSYRSPSRQASKPQPSSRPRTTGSPSPAPVGELSTRHAEERFRLYEPDCRRHYEQHYAAVSDYPYKEYARAYRYGLALAEDETYIGRDWPSVELEARRHWKARMSAPWSQFREAVRFAWYCIRGDAEKYLGQPPRR